MDSRSRLDYALFQLTPTRTRCDLIICAGDFKEKLTSGLLEPFIAHLKFAKDQISKGGYSITLSASDSASWFTKSTLERFVRFVSTPEVLERLTTIEKEIVNIDCSINTNASSDSQTVYGLEEHSKSNNSAYKHEWNTSDHDIHEEDPKINLQRVLETRKAVLQKEQAMVYARALVAGFETDNLQDLICFADAFGSPRLREACINFMELCNTKSNDRVWMDEVAAMQAYSRSQFVIPGEDDSIQELRINVQNGNFTNEKQNGIVDDTASNSSISHGNHPPQYMFQPPYPLVFPSYYQGNLPWNPNVEDYSRSREKRSQKKGSRKSKEDRNFESSDSSSGSDSSGYNKKSSKKKVIIRNINYITSKRNEKAETESDENSSNSTGVNQDLDRTSEDKITNISRQWNIFENLLLKDAEDKESEEVKNPYNGSNDLSSIIKKDNTLFEEEFVSRKFEEPNINPYKTQPEFSTKSSTIGKHQHEEGDWFSGSLQDKPILEKSKDIFEDNNCHSVKTTKDVLVRDPLAVQPRSLNESSDMNQLKTQDILMVSEGDYKKVEAKSVNEPNDLYMVPERDTSSQQAVTSWTPEMESTNINNNNKIVKLDSPEEKVLLKSKPKASVEKGLERKKVSTIEAKSKSLNGTLRKSKSTGTNPIIPKGKSQKEEERRKRMEELVAQRQKRIAERNASKIKTKKSEIPKDSLASQDLKKPNKPVIRSSTIDRLSAARVVTRKVLPTESKPANNKPTKVTTKENGQSKPAKNHTKVIMTMKDNGQPQPKPVKKPTKVTTKENGVARTLVSQKKAGTVKKEVKAKNKVIPLDKSIDSKTSYGTNSKKKVVEHVSNVKKLPTKESPVKKIGNGVADQVILSTPSNHQFPQSDNKKDLNEKALSDGNNGSANKALNKVSFNLDKDNNYTKGNHVVKANAEIPIREISTPTTDKGSVEINNPRKKWSKIEASSTKALKGFKKLLSFGRRS